MKQPLFTQML